MNNNVTLDLRQAVMQRMQDKSENELHEVVRDSIGGQDQILPGLGVLFEIIWQNIDQTQKNDLIHTLKEHL